MATKFLESGSAATFDMKFWTSEGGAGAATSDAGPPRSIKLTNFHQLNKTNVWTPSGNVSQGRVSFRFKMEALPGGQNSVLLLGPCNIGTEVTSAGVLKYTAPGGTVTGSTISASVEYRLSVAWTTDTSQSVNEIRWYLDGVLDGTNSNVLLSPGGVADIRISDPGNNSFFRDVFADDSNSLADIGDIRVTAKLPASNNVNQFTTAIGANPSNRWTNVNERALSETNGWLDAVNSDRENYGIEGLSAGDVDLTGKTLVARTAWIWAKGAVGGLGSPKITNNGVDTAIVLTGSPALYTNIVDSASYPAAADTIGMVSAGAADATSLYECGMLIAYIPAGGAATPAGAFSHVILTSRMRQW
jgi:hypothetical protein